MNTVSLKKYLFKGGWSLFMIIFNSVIGIIPFLFFFLADITYTVKFPFGILITFICFGFFILSRIDLYYIEVSPNEITKKNLWFFWIEEKIKKENIITIKLDKMSRKAGHGGFFYVRSLRILTNGQPLDLYPGDFCNEYFFELHSTLEKFNYRNVIFKEAPLPIKITPISDDLILPKLKEANDEKIIFNKEDAVWNEESISFNRKLGTVTFPSKFTKKHKTINFKSLKFYTLYYPVYPEKRGIYYEVIIQDAEDKELLSLYVTQHSTSFYSTLVWYMDKNRPLPPSKFFNKYRKQDYERRKHKGFPPPLYPSEIEITEETLNY